MWLVLLVLIGLLCCASFTYILFNLTSDRYYTSLTNLQVLLYTGMHSLNRMLSATSSQCRTAMV